MFSTDQTALRAFYKKSWDKLKNKENLSDLEKQVAAIILEHPEYHKFFDELDLNSDLKSHLGPDTPFMHLGLHLGIRDQIALNNPTGIREIYNQLSKNLETPHDAEHKMLEILAEELWSSQRNKTDFNTQEYLNKLSNLNNNKINSKINNKTKIKEQT
jgi:hypothetical protein